MVGGRVGPRAKVAKYDLLDSQKYESMQKMSSLS